MNSHSLFPVFPYKIFLAALALILGASLAANGQGGVDKTFSPPAPVLTPKSVPLNQSSEALESGAVIKLEVSIAPTEREIKSFQGMVEPLRPAFSGYPAADRTKLSAALNTWLKRPVSDDMSVLENFATTNPKSAWTPSINLNLGFYYYNTGYFSKAITAWEAAWNGSRKLKSPEAVAIANAAVAEYSVMLARLGRQEELGTLLDSLGERVFQGSALNQIERSREGLSNMRQRPGISFRCGPYALNLIHTQKTGSPVNGFLDKIQSPATGFSLAELKKFAAEDLAMPMQVAKRTPGTQLIIPSVVHWKVGHFGALMREQDGGVLLRDPTFGNDTWMTRSAIDHEGSGYFLVPVGKLPAGWTSVPDVEAATIYGKGHSGSSDGDETGECSKKSGTDCSKNPHMAGYSFHTLLASLNVSDIPVGYSAAYGPDVNFEVVYNMREAGQPASMDFTNPSPQWECNWVSYLEDNPSAPSANVRLHMRGGGAETHTGYTGTSSAGVYVKNRRWETVLVRTTANSYERRHPDGSKEVYAQAIGTTGPNRKVFLSQVVDPQGNAVTLTYNTAIGLPTRIWRITDAAGLITTLHYGRVGYDYLVTSVWDPFERQATFSYADIAGKMRLWKITDTIGIESQFEYNASGQITALTTPYGRTTFDFGAPYLEYGLIRWIEATDPQGSKERLECYLEEDITGVTSASVAPEVPTVPGLSFINSDMDDRNTFYWSKKAWAMAPGDYSKAHLQHWLQIDGADFASGVLGSEKAPFESRIWYRYPGQPAGSSMNLGSSPQPSTIARVVESEGSPGGKATQAIHMTYNDLGNPLTMIDPVGRETSIEYESTGVGNGIAPKFVKQKVGGVFQTIQSYTYDAAYPAHRPKTITDASGQTTTLTYNNFTGQVTTVTNALNETTTLSYGPTTIDPLRPKGRVYQITGPGTGNTISLEYDGYQRPCKVTDQSGHITLYDYDVFNRVTFITYPDTTTEQFVYDRLDLYAQKDRQGRWTRTWHNALRQPVLTADAIGRTIQMEWCKCGALQKLTDGKNQTTSWKYDAQGRNYEKTYPDNRKEFTTYEPFSGQVATTTDAAGQIKTFKHILDGNQKSLSYSNLASGTATTEGVSYTYDPDVDRPATMTDGTGVTTFGYYATVPATLGALRLKTVNGPLSGDTDLITYTYDALGRLKTGNVGALGNENTTTRNYDALGRIQSVVNPLGTFNHFYVGATGRRDYITYPNGQKTTFGYFPNSGDNRLQTITHLSDESVPTSILSKFDYTYNKDGAISTWQRQFGSAAPTKYSLGYDKVDQLVSATLALANAPNTLQERYSYQYDTAGNRTSAQKGNMANTAASDAANRITGLSGGGQLLVTGTTDEPATVKVNGIIATTTPAPENLYEAWINVAEGVNNLTVEATNFAAPPKTSTRTWSVNITGSSPQTFTYDSNGNTLSDGLRGYQWDAENRLIKVTQGGNIYEFAYDGFSRRVTEKVNGTVTKRWIWDAARLAEQRAANETSVDRRYYYEGEKRIGGGDAGNYYYTRDHLGSIREISDSASPVQVRARYDYDPYGGVTKLSGDLDCDFGFTGHLYHGQSGLNLTLFRAYDQRLGRWLSPDPAGEFGGLNLYAYVEGDPFNSVDPFGLWQITIYGGHVFGGYFTIGYSPSSDQWNFGARAGVAEGISGSIDFSDSGCKHAGLGFAGGFDGTLGAGIIGGSAGFGSDSKQGDYGYAGGRFWRWSRQVNYTNEQPLHSPNWKKSVSNSVTNTGASGFLGAGISYTTKSNGSCP